MNNHAVCMIYVRALVYIPNLLWGLLADTYCSWQYNETSKTKKFHELRSGDAAERESRKEDPTDNIFQMITLSYADFPILSEVSVKALALVDDQINDMQTYTSLSRSIHENFRLMLYIKQWMLKNGVALINWSQSKSFDKFDHETLAARLKAAAFDQRNCLLQLDSNNVQWPLLEIWCEWLLIGTFWCYTLVQSRFLLLYVLTLNYKLGCGYLCRNKQTT